MSYRIHTIESAPEQSRSVLRELLQTFGLIPNLAGAMAESPLLINSFISLFQKVHASGFSEAQIQTLLLTNAVTNTCPWAVAFHTALALKEGLAPVDVQAIREGRAPADARYAALSTLARRLIETRGHLEEPDTAAFLAAGFTPAQVLDVLTVTAASAITNYAGNITQPAVETPFQAHRWQSQAA